MTKLDFGQIIFTNEQEWDVCKDPETSPLGTSRQSAKSITRKSKTKIERVSDIPLSGDRKPFGLRANTFLDTGPEGDVEDDSFDHLMEGLEQF
mmetsp:Transcript_13859/g.21613  ORF Transcript_13859/g.21613 Transcript_13859/m.21613 type:complete len:93 (+) Transcript_13859:80-358(+)